LGSAPATRPLQPGHRTWILQVDGRPRGRLIVAVERGIGELGGWIDAEIDPGKALDALDRRLGADLQVVELRCRPAGPLLLHDTLARRGFTFRGGTAVLVRQATDHTIIGAPT
ncbi:MAG: hypothetical protein ACE5GB_07205, partial [Acidimicrobiales bacterium]